MLKSRYREVSSAFLGGLVRLRKFVRTFVGFKVTRIPEQEIKWEAIPYTFETLWYARVDSSQGVIRPHSISSKRPEGSEPRGVVGGEESSDNR